MHLLGSPCGRFSIHRFYNDLRSQGIAVAKDTLYAFVDYLEDAYLVRTISIAAESARRRMANPRKGYPIDPGLIPVFDRTGRANIGHALETAVALELARRGAEITYVRTKEGWEVDFLAHYAEGHQELIQVCSDLADPKTLDREIRALEGAAGSYPRARKYIVTLTPSMVSGVPDDISVQDAAAWLLGSHNLE